MRIFSFISSIITAVITAIFLFTDFPDLDTLEGILYFLLFIVLFAICITGMFINTPHTTRASKKFRIAGGHKH